MLLAVASAMVLAVLPLAGQQQQSALTGSRGCAADANVCIRIENATNIDFDRFEVHFPDRRENFGHLRAGDVTPYRRVGQA